MGAPARMCGATRRRCSKRESVRCQMRPCRHSGPKATEWVNERSLPVSRVEEKRDAFDSRAVGNRRGRRPDHVIADVPRAYTRQQANEATQRWCGRRQGAVRKPQPAEGRSCTHAVCPSRLHAVRWSLRRSAPHLHPHSASACRDVSSLDPKVPALVEHGRRINTITVRQSTSGPGDQGSPRVPRKPRRGRRGTHELPQNGDGTSEAGTAQPKPDTQRVHRSAPARSVPVVSLVMSF